MANNWDKRFKGVLSIMSTPFSQNGELVLDSIRVLVGISLIFHVGRVRDEWRRVRVSDRRPSSRRLKHSPSGCRSFHESRILRSHFFIILQYNGVGALLNTSTNLPGLPIVLTPEGALAALKNCDFDRFLLKIRLFAEVLGKVLGRWLFIQLS